MSKVKDYSEKIIREKIISKIKPQISSKRSKHNKGWIIIKGKKLHVLNYQIHI
jgi:hypothetical protein